MKATTIAAALALLASSALAQNSTCAHVPSSSICSPWENENFFVRYDLAPDLKTNNPGLAAVTDIAGLDRYISSRLTAKSPAIEDIKTRFGCPKMDVTQFRYWGTFQCGFIGWLSSGDACGATKAICKSSCLAAKASFESMFSNANICPVNTTIPSRPNTLKWFDDVCNSATDNEGCIKSIPSEETNGFVNPAAAKQWCDAGGKEEFCSKLASSGGTGSNLKVVIPAIIGGIVGFIVLIVLISMFVKRRRRNSVDNVQPTEISQTMEVVYNFVPNLTDEVYLHVGDLIVVKVTYDDGWAFGYNLNTKEEGAFPMACLSDVTSEDHQRMTVPAGGGEFTDAVKKRASSLYTQNLRV